MVELSVRQNPPTTVARNSHSYPRPDEPDHHHVDLPETDPRHPRYEPAHLRHRPGDTWIIDRNRPADPDDPGPYGSPNWRPDQRTGRHRRSELPDPIAAPNPQPVQPAPRPWPFWDQPPAFTRLQEDAWNRWLIDSAPLAAAHRTGPSATERECGRTIANLIGLIRWIIAVIKRPQDTEPKTTPKQTPHRQEPHQPQHPARAADRQNHPNHRPSPHPRDETVYIRTWERQFDSLSPAGGAL